MEALKVEGLSKNFGGVQALKNVSFTVEAGERLAIIGPNGAGKTTLFNLLTGQESATAGRIYFFGKEITNMPTHRCAHIGLGRSFQIVSLFPGLTVLDNAMLAVQGINPCRFQLLRPITAYKRLFTEAQKLLGVVALWEQKDKLVKNISYGEQRRLELALSVASKTKLLLLDEPNCGLTMAEGSDIISVVDALEEDITVLLVSHDMDLVFGLTKRIIVLHYGEIIGSGTPEEVKANPMVKEVYMGIKGGTENATAT
jgi:branched-chain amino acid transport system ATP-binding protein